LTSITAAIGSQSKKGMSDFIYPLPVVAVSKHLLAARLKAGFTAVLFVKFMIATVQPYSTGIQHFQGEKQAHNLDLMQAHVHEIAIENVCTRLNITAVVGRESAVMKKKEKFPKATLNIAKHFAGSVYS
jgi:hypothetical protein